MVKVVFDIAQGVMALDAELHADEEEVLLERGSKPSDLWGINIYHALSREEWIEFDSMINIRPSVGNKSRNIENEQLRKRVIEIVAQRIK